MPENSKELLAQMDAAYRPFPGVEEWENVQVDRNRWDRCLQELDNLRSGTNSELWEEAKSISFKMAAIDTGAIEGLYEVDRGFTFTVAAQTASLSGEIQKRFEDIKDFYEAQLDGYNLTLDAITKTKPLSEAWIRSLHEVLTKAQETYTVYTASGWQEQSLPRGEYKRYPNHVIDKDGKPKFSYAPVDSVRPEMQRFVEDLRSDTFTGLHPVVQAAFAHYAFVRIHPFADGNGRVARALGSLYLTKAASIPLVVFADQRNLYIDALELADSGEFSAFTDFIGARVSGAVEIIDASIKTASMQPAQSQFDKLSNLYTAFRGIRHTELDDYARQLAAFALKEAERQIAQLHFPASGKGSVSNATANYSRAAEDQFRALVNDRPTIDIRMNSPAPAQALKVCTLRVFVAKQDTPNGELLLESSGNETLLVKIAELYPSVTAEFEIKLKLWIDGVLRHMASDLLADAQKSLRDSGYLGT